MFNEVILSNLSNEKIPHMYSLMHKNSRDLFSRVSVNILFFNSVSSHLYLLKYPGLMVSRVERLY